MALRGFFNHYYSDAAAARLLRDVRYIHILAATGATALMILLSQELPRYFITSWLSTLLCIQGGLTLVPLLFRHYGCTNTVKNWLVPYGALSALGHLTWGCLFLTFADHLTLWQQILVMLLLFVILSMSMPMLARFYPLFCLDVVMLGLPFLALLAERQDFAWQLWFVAGLLLMGTLSLLCRGHTEAQQHLDAVKRDPLTGLLNREACITALASTAGETRGALICRLHNYRAICDAFGNRAGDAVLQHCANSLRYVSEQQKLTGRVGENEFFLPLAVADSTLWQKRSRHLLRQIGAQMSWGEHLIALDIGIGLAELAGTPEEALRHAQLAAAVRNPHSQINQYHPELWDRLQRDVSLRSALQSTALYEQLTLHFQPKKQLRDGAINGAEALLRWQHPELGAIPPDEFIAIAEQSEVINDLGDWVIQQAARHLAEIPGDAPFCIAVNVSMAQFTSPRLLASLRDAVAELPSNRRLELEITESVMMLEPSVVNDTLATLASLGVNVALDDFGTGYSSLQYLATLPIHTLKIDRSFVSDLTQDKHRAVIKVIIEMAHALGINVVAEGVESAEQLAVLAEYHCDEVQGYHIARPAPFSSLVAALR